MTKANDRQVGGDHYRKNGSEVQHWDYARMKNFDFFQYQITKYVERWKDKNGIIDLEKARHFLDKYIEVEKAKQQKPLPWPAKTVTIERGELPPKISGQANPFGFEEDKDALK
jgi:hypothetical protein